MIAAEGEQKASRALREASEVFDSDNINNIVNIINIVNNINIVNIINIVNNINIVNIVVIAIFNPNSGDVSEQFSLAAAIPSGIFNLGFNWLILCRRIIYFFSTSLISDTHLYDICHWYLDLCTDHLWITLNRKLCRNVLINSPPRLWTASARKRTRQWSSLCPSISSRTLSTNITLHKTILLIFKWKPSIKMAWSR